MSVMYLLRGMLLVSRSGLVEENDVGMFQHNGFEIYEGERSECPQYVSVLLHMIHVNLLHYRHCKSLVTMEAKGEKKRDVLETLYFDTNDFSY